MNEFQLLPDFAEAYGARLGNDRGWTTGAYTSERVGTQAVRCVPVFSPHLASFREQPCRSLKSF